jgi:glutaconate CoA-transferase subunit A
MKRESKVQGLSEAIKAFMKDSELVAIGGQYLHNNPMGLVRELIRQKVRIKALVTSVNASINADMLIGAGLVEELISPFVGFEHLGLAPNFRRFIEQGRLKLHECDEAFIVYGLLAGAGGIPFIPYPERMFPGASMLNVASANLTDYKTTQDPFTGKQVVAINAIRPDVALIHCQLADPYGNSIFLGATFTDYLMIQSSRKTVVMVEEIISNEDFVDYSEVFKVPAFMIDSVVKVPFGCHPTSSHGFYTYDEDHLNDYKKLATSDENFRTYIKQYVTDLPEEKYFPKLGGEMLLRKLQS